MLPHWLALLSLFFFPTRLADESAGAGLCDGCVGTGTSSVASGGQCTGASVSVSVTVTGGACAWVFESPTSPAECRERRACQVTVERSWSNLPANSPIDLCVTLPPGDQTLCLGKNPPTSGATGSGTDLRTGPDMGCSDGTRTYSLTSSVCGLSASAIAACSACNGAAGGEGEG